MKPTTTIDTLIAYILAVAGQEEEFFRRDLGPIHVLKYVYLADLAHADANGGRTLTGIPWRFYHFGPWSQDVHARIEPVAYLIHAQERIISSPKHPEDVKHWVLAGDVDDEVAEWGRALPLVCRQAVKRAVHQFANDTYGLLHHVYKTAPMLRARPNEMLSFVSEPDGDAYDATPVTERTEASAKERKRRQQARLELRERLRASLAAKAEAAKHPGVDAGPLPRYDDVFEQGVAWLDSLAGESPPSIEGVLDIGDIWDLRRAGGE